MKCADSVNALEAAWSDEHGFLFQLRMGNFSTSNGERFLAVLREIEPGEEAIPKRVVSLLWYLPVFMTWQQQRIDTATVPEFEKLHTALVTELERILGVP